MQVQEMYRSLLHYMVVSLANIRLQYSTMQRSYLQL